MFDERLLITQNVITNSDIILRIENLLESDRNKSVKNRFEYSIVTQNDDFDDITSTRNHDSILSDDDDEIINFESSKTSVINFAILQSIETQVSSSQSLSTRKHKQQLMNSLFTSSRTSSSSVIKFNTIAESITSFASSHRRESNNNVLGDFVEELRDTIVINAQKRTFKDKEKEKINRLSFINAHELKMIRLKNEMIR